jgi:hypothetical protein
LGDCETGDAEQQQKYADVPDAVHAIPKARADPKSAGFSVCR